MSKTLIIVIAATATVLLLGGAAWAKHGGCFRVGGPEGMVKYVTGRLDLNETQRANLEDFADALAGLRGQWRENRQRGRGELLVLLDDSALDRARAGELLEQRHLAWRQSGKELVERFADFSDSLSAGQRERLRSLIEERSNRGWQRRAWFH